MAAAAVAAARQRITGPFRVGQKEQYLPKFTIALLRDPNLTPYQARFLVPLWFSKLDLRDYLYHAYNVPTLFISSYVKQQRAQFGDRRNPENPSPIARRWHRPRAKKYMTVQLERPFVWPEEPEDLTAWSSEDVEKQTKDQKKMQERLAPFGDTVINDDRRETLKEQAKALLEGKAEWTPRTQRYPTSMISR